jgi:hypothetical protein
MDIFLPFCLLLQAAAVHSPRQYHFGVTFFACEIQPDFNNPGLK